MATKTVTEEQHEKQTNGNGATAIAKPAGMDSIMDSIKGLGFNTDNVTVEHVQQGGVTKWLDLKQYMAKPDAAQNQPVGGNGEFFAGLLLGRQEMEDDKSEDINADGVKVRYFYTVKLGKMTDKMMKAHCTYKDEDGKAVKYDAKEGDIIAVGERHSLKTMRTWVDDGGLYFVIIRPHSRIGIGDGQTMWTFDVTRVVLKAPPPKVEIVGRKNNAGNTVPF